MCHGHIQACAECKHILQPLGWGERGARRTRREGGGVNDEHGKLPHSSGRQNLGQCWVKVSFAGFLLLISLGGISSRGDAVIR